MTFGRDQQPFFVQEYPRGVWHVETPDDPEHMLCGVIISVESVTARVSRTWGTKPCLWCRHRLEELSSGGSSSRLRRTTKTSGEPWRSPRVASTTSYGADSS